MMLLLSQISNNVIEIYIYGLQGSMKNIFVFLSYSFIHKVVIMIKKDFQALFHRRIF